MVYHEKYQILAPGDARCDGMLWAGYGKDQDGWTDFDKVLWAKPTIWNKIWLRWKGRHSFARGNRGWKVWL
jgi:hypothetical protein